MTGKPAERIKCRRLVRDSLGRPGLRRTTRAQAAGLSGPPVIPILRRRLFRWCEVRAGVCRARVRITRPNRTIGVLGLIALALGTDPAHGRPALGPDLQGPTAESAALLLRARDTLALGDLGAAIRLGERYTRRYPEDPAGPLLLGDAYMRRMPAGRFRAMEYYRAAQRLAPESPVPPYRLAVAAFYIGGADGERIAREGLERILALDPAYPGAWEKWRLLYRSPSDRRKVIGLLRTHAASAKVAERLSVLYIEDEQYPTADSVLDGLLVGDETNASWLALRAQSAFEAGDTATGVAFYQRAIADADRDSVGVLWQQVVGIASPSEFLAWEGGIPPKERGAWLTAFWARRNPDLFAGANGRIVEHFARLRYARTRYPLLHPMVSYQRDAVTRAMNLEPSRGERQFHLRCEVYQSLPPSSGGHIALPGVSSARARAATDLGILSHLTDEEKQSALATVRAAAARGRLSQLPNILQEALREAGDLAFAPTQFAPLGFDLRDVDSVAARIGYSLATGLDDRGLMYLRFGKPEQEVLGGDNSLDPQCNTSEVERWRYPGIGEVRFAKPNAFSRGLRVVPEMVFRPMNPDQLEVTRAGLTRDASSEPAPLEFGVWTAQFRNRDDPAVTDVLVVSTVGRLAAALVPPQGLSRAQRESATGRVTLIEGRGTFVLLAHARRGDELGRQSLRLAVRDFRGRAMSDLLVAPAWDAPVDSVARSDMIDRAPRDLTFAAGAPVRAYLELYGLAGPAGRRAFRARFLVLRTGNAARDIARERWEGATTFEFDRVLPQPGEAPVSLALDIQPGYLPRGTYLLRAEVVDLPSGNELGRATIAFMVR
jgi:tetratricopeptide (TPR) repeat protein